MSVIILIIKIINIIYTVLLLVAFLLFAFGKGRISLNKDIKSILIGFILLLSYLIWFF